MMMRNNIRTYTELSKLRTFDERFEYLCLHGLVGEDTFGHDRYLNQMFYKSQEWRNFRDKIIVRDNGNDLGVDGFAIQELIIVHHLIPITVDDILNRSDILLNPEFAICTSSATHKAIHYGDIKSLTTKPIERSPRDTCLW